MSVLFTRRGPAPGSGGSGGGGISGTLLSDLEEGSIVLIPENGVNVEFYVAKQDYESGLNGTGRTLLVRKNCLSRIVWSSNTINAYDMSSIDEWLNGDYKATLDSEVQTAIGSTTFYYTIGGGDDTVSTLTRDVFLLSVNELGKMGDTGYGGRNAKANAEGTTLSIAATLIKVYDDANSNSLGSVQWTRTPDITNDTNAFYIGNSGMAASYSCNDLYPNACPRPCFTLPSNAVFDPDTREFLGVA